MTPAGLGIKQKSPAGLLRRTLFIQLVDELQDDEHQDDSLYQQGIQQAFKKKWSLVHSLKKL
ncbi:MAG: hypothetical protein BroJett042_32360 [Bacteroidota bacterium]|nr:MAG: hypothetical protein BroJett042_32360 [Bacteroidota bacterium]